MKTFRFYLLSMAIIFLAGSTGLIGVTAPDWVQHPENYEFIVVDEGTWTGKYPIAKKDDPTWRAPWQKNPQLLFKRFAQVLEKANKEGIDSLSTAERKFIFQLAIPRLKVILNRIQEVKQAARNARKLGAIRSNFSRVQRALKKFRAPLGKSVYSFDELLEEFKKRRKMLFGK